MMGLAENKKLILEHYESFINRQDVGAVRGEIAADFIDHEMPPGTPPGPESVINLRAMLHSAFPDLHVTIDEIIAEADLVAVRATWDATHRGTFPLIPVPVSNRKVTFRGMVFWRIRDGKIIERWANIDRLGLQQQLTGAPRSDD
jgi:steroid delta-isomerase-like uncharacterized protein